MIWLLASTSIAIPEAAGGAGLVAAVWALVSVLQRRRSPERSEVLLSVLRAGQQRIEDQLRDLDERMEALER